MAFAETLDDFLDTDDGFAISVTVGGVSMRAIFDNGYDTTLGAAGTQPQLSIKSSDVAATARNTAVVVNSVNYTVAEILPDGTGLSVVLLQKT